MAGGWRRMALVPTVAAALLAGGPGPAWASAPQALVAPTQVVATIPAGPIVISFQADDTAMLDLAAVHGRRVLEDERAQVIHGIRIVDTRAPGALPWVMTVESGPEGIIVTIG